MVNEMAQQSSARLASWLEQALPLWAQQGIDADSGFAYDFLMPDGTADRASHRNLAVQARQIYAFSRAEKMSWISGMRADVERMTSTAIMLGTSPCRSDGFVHVLDSHLQIVDADHYVQDHAWFMMSSAAAWHAYRSGTELRRSYNIFEWLERRYALDGGWTEGSSAGRSLRLSTQIQVCEAVVYIYECCGKEKWAEHAADFHRHFVGRIFDGSIGSLAEHRLPDWSPDRRADWLVPGDLFRLVSLLGRIEKATSVSTRDAALDIYRQARRLACNDKCGLVSNRITPSGDVMDSGKRICSLLQHAGAAITAAGFGEDSVHAVLQQSVTALFDCYLNKDMPGLFVECVDGDHLPLSNRSHASDICHIVDFAIRLSEFADSGG